MEMATAANSGIEINSFGKGLKKPLGAGYFLAVGGWGFKFPNFHQTVKKW